MSTRKIALDIKVQALQEGLHFQDAEAIAHKYGVSKRSLFVWFDKVKDHLPEILQETKPGPKGVPPRLRMSGGNR